jgi:hypothetical protein
MSKYQPETLGHYKRGKHNPWLDEELLELLHQRKQAKVQWLQVSRTLNGDNLNNVRREASRHFRKKKRENLKDKIKDPATNSKNKENVLRNK